MSEALVEVQELSKGFDVSKPWLNRVVEREPRQVLRAVQDVSFAIGRGETFALVGESGSGKSTVAKIVVGLIPADRGRVSIDGIDFTDRRRRANVQRARQKIQMIFQDPFASLNPRMRVARIIGEPLEAFGLVKTRREERERVADLLGLVGLDPRDGAKFPHEFSGGQRQRICIARALASRPAFLVADEPTSALDVSVQAQILNLMKDLQDELALTYLFISHNLAVVRHMASRIGVLYLGRLAEVASADALFRIPRHPYTRMLLEAIPDLEMRGRRRRIEGEVPNPITPPSGCAFHPRCPLATDRCRAETPALLPNRGALVACHAAEEGRA